MRMVNVMGAPVTAPQGESATSVYVPTSDGRAGLIIRTGVVAPTIRVVLARSPPLCRHCMAAGGELVTVAASVTLSPAYATISAGITMDGAVSPMDQQAD